MQRAIREAIESKMFPHFLSSFQWILLVITLAFNLNFSVAVTGAVANSGLKVIMLFHLWMFFSSVVFCLIFCRIRKEGIAERYIIGLSVITTLFSVLNISLLFVDDFVLLMKATELISWSLYNCIFSLSMYKILVVYLLPLRGRFAGIKEETLRNDEKLLA